MAADFELAGRSIGEGHRCFVIAEAGVNHNGDAGLARALVDAAADAGADAVKFQTFEAAAVAGPAAMKAAYQAATTGWDESQVDMLRRLELPHAVFVELKSHAEARGLVFLSTPFDPASVEFLDMLGVAGFKVSSGDITNVQLLDEIGRRRKPVLLSTGAADLEDVATALGALRSSGAAEVALLHCVSAYPAPAESVNLRAMATLRETFSVPVGYSDHTEGSEIALAAVARGASILEKHFTLDRSLPGPDHRASLEPTELATLVESVRRVELSLGDGLKRASTAELETASSVRRSLAAADDLPSGTVLAAHMLTALRPGTGFPPTRIGEVVGRRLVRALGRGELLAPPDLE